MKLCKLLLITAAILLIAQAACATDAVRIGITRFEPKTSGISRSDAEAITDELTRMLTSSYSIAIVDRESMETIAREHRLNLSGLMDPRTAAQLGKIAGIQYIVKGSITNYGITKTAEAKQENAWAKLLLGDKLVDTISPKKSQSTETAEITLDLSLIDVNTMEAVMSIMETGTATNTKSEKSQRDAQKSSREENLNLQRAAVSDAVARIGYRIKEKIAGEYPQVLNEGSREIIISIGATSGVRVGNIYKISLEGEEIKDMRGNVIGKRTTPLAVVEVSEVQNDFSVAKAANNGGNISLARRGDRVESITRREFSDLVSKNSFPRSRPGGSLRDLSSRSNSLTETVRNTPTETARRYEPETVTDIRRNTSAKLENMSTSSAKVIDSYGLPADEASGLKRVHKEAERMRSNDDKFERYTELFRNFPYDYFAAYQAAKIMFDIADYVKAVEWAEKSLSVNPRYSPAKKLLKAAKANQ